MIRKKNCVVLVSLLLSVFPVIQVSAAGASSPPIQFGIGAWAPADTTEWDTGGAIWVSGQANRFAGRLLVGRTRDASDLHLGDFTMTEVSLEYRLKPLAERKRGPNKGFDWYAGIGLAYSAMTKDSDNLEVTDGAIGTAASIGMKWGSFGIDIHAWRGKDSVDLGGTLFSLSYSF